MLMIILQELLVVISWFIMVIAVLVSYRFQIFKIMGVKCYDLFSVASKKLLATFL